MNRAAVLGVDLETCSAVDLKRDGAWIYSRHESTRVHCAVFGLADGGRPYQLHRWTPGQQLPEWIEAHMRAGKHLLAHNATFEQAIIENVLAKHHGWPNPPLQVWRDTASMANAMNLPYSLAGLASVFKGATKKDSEGADLMRRVARVLPAEDGGWRYPVMTPDELARLIDYCQTDVEVMLDCYFRMPSLSLVEGMVEGLDRRINHRGVCVDLEFAQQMLRMVAKRKRELQLSAFGDSDTHLADAVSAPGMKTWLQERGIVLPTTVRVRRDGTREKTPTIDKKAVLKLLESHGLDPTVRSVLETRLEAGKLTSLAKLKRLSTLVDSDGRVRNLLHYCAAGTGRWASRQLQLHNLPKDKTGASTFVRAMVRSGDMEGLTLVAARPLDALSQSLRGVIVAAPGFDLLGGDYAAVEARIVAWLAGQQDSLDAFADPTRDIYVEDNAKVKGPSRQFGKIVRLGLGFGMGAVKFAAQAAIAGFVLPLKEARRVQLEWRAANPAIVQFWTDLETAVRDCIRKPGSTIKVGAFLTVRSNTKNFTIELPSGRRIYYWRPRLQWVKKRFETVDEHGNLKVTEREIEEIQYFEPDGASTMGVDSTYGGKLAENVTQAVARDLLAAAIIDFEHLPPYRVVMHVHDSLVVEVPEGTGDIDEFCRVMAKSRPWAPGLPVKVEGYRSKHFRG